MRGMSGSATAAAARRSRSIRQTWATLPLYHTRCNRAAPPCNPFILTHSTRAASSVARTARPASVTWSLTEAASRLRSGSIDALSLTQRLLDHIASPLSPPLNDFITPTPDLALSQARASADRLPSSPLSLLDGIPIAVKDNFSLAGERTTAGSRMLADYRSPFDAEVVRRLRAAGAVFVGKTNLDEFGMGSDTVNSAFGPTVNPWSSTQLSAVNGAASTDALLSPGGSSGGSAAAVASYRAYAAIGSDTGGSVRLPASYCGVVGFKPTYGAVSRYGLVAYASSLDTPGIIARRVADCRAVFRVVAGWDEKDSTSLPPLPPSCEQPSSLRSLADATIGVPVECNVAELSEEMRDAWSASIGALQDAGATVVTVSLPHTPLALSTYYILAPAEASSNLARYDGVRYGHSASTAASAGPARQALMAQYAATRSEGFGAEVQRRLLLGTFVLSSAAYSSFFHKAQHIRALVTADYRAVFDGGPRVDALLCPTAVACAGSIGEAKRGGLRGWVNDVMTVGVSLAGLPAISVPVGVGKETGLPLGMQLIGRWREDERLLDVAEILEQCMQQKTGYKLP